MRLHNFDGAGFVVDEILGLVDCAEVAVSYRILNLIFFHSIDSL